MMKGSMMKGNGWHRETYLMVALVLLIVSSGCLRSGREKAEAPTPPVTEVEPQQMVEKYYYLTSKEYTCKLSNGTSTTESYYRIRLNYREGSGSKPIQVVAINADADTRYTSKYWTFTAIKEITRDLELERQSYRGSEDILKRADIFIGRCTELRMDVQYDVYIGPIEVAPFGWSPFSARVYINGDISSKMSFIPEEIPLERIEAYVADFDGSSLGGYQPRFWETYALPGAAAVEIELW